MSGGLAPRQPPGQPPASRSTLGRRPLISSQLDMLENLINCTAACCYYLIKCKRSSDTGSRSSYAPHAARVDLGCDRSRIYLGGLRTQDSGFHPPESTLHMAPAVLNIIATLNVWMGIKLGNFSLEIAKTFHCFKKYPAMNTKSAMSEQVNIAKISLNSII